MAVSTSGVTYSNSGAAAADIVTFSEDATAIQYFDVMANDGGGAKTTLYSIDDGTGAKTTTGGVSILNDLLTKDTATQSTSLDTTKLGAKIWIENGKVGLDPNSYNAETLAKIQALPKGEYLEDTFVYAIKMANGTLAWTTCTIRIEGKNDAASISGTKTGDITEDSGAYVAQGKLTVTDKDTGENVVKADVIHNAYGTFEIQADGSWKFTADNGALQSLDATDVKELTFTVTSKDGTGTETVTVTIHGINDIATISGAMTGDVTEGGADTDVFSGKLTVSDVDHGEAFVKPLTDSSSSYGTFSITADGNWTFSPNAGAIDALAAGETEVLTYTVESKDGTGTETVTVTVHGTNDTASITGKATGDVFEDGTLSASGKLTVSDADHDQSAAVAFTDSSSAYGTFDVKADGSWTFDANNGALQSLDGDDTVDLTYTVKSVDGTGTQNVTVIVHGTNDAATFGGTSTGVVTEDALTNTASGQVSVTDKDHDQSSIIAQTNVSGTYGTFSIGTNGAWTYTLDNSKTATNALTGSDHPVETFEIVSADGTKSSVSITVNGHDDAAALPTDYTGSAADPNDFDSLTGGTRMTNNNSFDDNAQTGFGNDGNQSALTLGGGNDTYYAQGGADTVSGGTGVDKIYGQAGNDTLHGDEGNDALYGGSGNDIIYGDDNNDTIYGGSGNDTIYGGAGSDVIYGGYGADTISGNGGNDIFVFLDLKDTNDTITDYSRVVGDTDKLDFAAIYSGTLALGTAHDGSVEAYSVNYYTSGGNTIVVVDTDGNTATAEFSVTLNGIHALNGSDFIL